MELNVQTSKFLEDKTEKGKSSGLSSYYCQMKIRRPVIQKTQTFPGIQSQEKFIMRSLIFVQQLQYIGNFYHKPHGINEYLVKDTN